MCTPALTSPADPFGEGPLSRSLVLLATTGRTSPSCLLGVGDDTTCSNTHTHTKTWPHAAQKLHSRDASSFGKYISAKANRRRSLIEGTKGGEQRTPTPEPEPPPCLGPCCQHGMCTTCGSSIRCLWLIRVCSCRFRAFFLCKVRYVKVVPQTTTPLCPYLSRHE